MSYIGNSIVAHLFSKDKVGRFFIVSFGLSSGIVTLENMTDTIESLTEKIKDAANCVRKLKEEKKDFKDALAVLLDLKGKFKALAGHDFGKEVRKIYHEIAGRGERVR